MRHYIHLAMAVVISLTCWPTESFGNSYLWRQQQMQQQRMQQQQMRRQQEMQRQQREMQRRQQEAQRRQMQEQRRRQQAAMQQRQREMQVRKQQMQAQRQKMAEQRRLQQQKRQQDLQRKQAQRQQTARKQAQQTARIARDRAIRLQRDRRLQDLRKRTRLQQQNQQRQKAAQQTNTLALLSRSSASRATTLNSNAFKQRRQDATQRFAKLRASKSVAKSGSAKLASQKVKTPAVANKQFQQKKLQEFRNRQASKNASKNRPKSQSKLANLKRNGACSFHGDTLVLTTYGFVPIRDIKPEYHKVFSKSEVTGETSWQTVLSHYFNHYDVSVLIDVRDTSTNHIHKIHSNQIHPFFALPQPKPSLLNASSNAAKRGQNLNGHWIEAQNLKKGHKLFSLDGWDIVEGVSIQQRPFRAYNLTVDKFHTYFVTSSSSVLPVWVHNDCWSKQPSGYSTTTRLTQFGHKIYKNASGKEIYQGHDRRFYDLKKHPPSVHKRDYVATQAKRHGWTEVKGKHSHGEKVWKSKNNRYFTYDKDGHNGSVWKMAKKPGDFTSTKRLGSFDSSLNRIKN